MTLKWLANRKAEAMSARGRASPHGTVGDFAVGLDSGDAGTAAPLATGRLLTDDHIEAWLARRSWAFCGSPEPTQLDPRVGRTLNAGDVALSTATVAPNAE